MPDIIDEMAGLSDAELAKKLGFEDKVAQFKKDLEVSSKLTGDARGKVVAQMNRIFGPDNYELQDLHRTVDRAANPKKETPSKFLSNCGCVDPFD